MAKSVCSGLDKEIAWLQCQLLEAQRQTKEISQKLEDPQNDKRWRRLLGTDPEVEQLEARIQQLEDAIDCKEVTKSTPSFHSIVDRNK